MQAWPAPERGARPAAPHARQLNEPARAGPSHREGAHPRAPLSSSFVVALVLVVERAFEADLRGRLYTMAYGLDRGGIDDANRQPPTAKNASCGAVRTEAKAEGNLSEIVSSPSPDCNIPLFKCASSCRSAGDGLTLGRLLGKRGLVATVSKEKDQNK